VPRRRSENRPFRLGRPTRDPHERAWLPKTVPRSSWRGRFEVPRFSHCDISGPPLRVKTQTSTPNGIRTRAAALKGRCPRPLDDGGGTLGV
jgi:hypothetical protein